MLKFVVASFGRKMHCRRREGLWTVGLGQITVPVEHEFAYWLEAPDITFVVSARNQRCVSVRPTFGDGRRGKIQIYDPAEGRTGSYSLDHKGDIFIVELEFEFDANGPPLRERVVAAPQFERIPAILAGPYFPH